ncbi:MAG: MBL fold metallo-hydrolase [Pelosinus sp.]|nr:MBL fold metallo-hydrolase [Pelosinus sp.]
MLEEILPNLFRITIPLPEHSLKTMNSYVLVAKERSLLIDTGWNRWECAEVLLDGLAAIGVSLKRVDVFLTHIHADHAGLLGLLKNKGAKVFCGGGDLACIDHYINISKQKAWSTLRHLAEPHGFSTEEIAAAIEHYPGNNYAPDYQGELMPVKDGDKFVIGEYSLSAVSTPGHTPGHMCLYDGKHKLLLAGDHLLGEFSPTICQWVLPGSYVAEYLASLKKIESYSVRLVLPGHWDTFTNFRHRIEVAKSYRQKRHADILAVMADSTFYTAYQIAGDLFCNENKNAWIFQPIMKKWGAVGDTVAELCYLRD